MAILKAWNSCTSEAEQHRITKSEKMPGLERELKGLKLSDSWTGAHLDKTSYLDTSGSGCEVAADRAIDPYKNHRPHITKKTLHDALRQAGQHVPRYLFRVWCSLSGGDARLNTVNAITPLAFLHSPDRYDSMFDMEPHTLHRLIDGHLGASHVRTVFSSWSHSLPFVLSTLRSLRGPYVSVIDTHALRPANFIFHCAFKGFPEEFLVFGRVEGDAHRAVPLQALDALLPSLNMSAYRPIPSAPPKRTPTKPARLERAKAFGELFGPEFELPMAVYYLSMDGDIRGEELVQSTLIADLEMPDSWMRDIMFPILDSSDGYTAEAVNASLAMRLIAKKLQDAGRIPKGEGGEKQDPAPEDTAADLEMEMEMETQTETDGKGKHKQVGRGGGKGRQHLKKPARMSRAAYELYIDMVGYEEHNEALRA